MIIANRNLLKDAVITATNEHTSYPVYNVVERWKKQVFRTADGTTTTTISADWGGVEKVSSLFVMFHNALSVAVRFYDGGLVDTWTEFVVHKEVEASRVEIDLVGAEELYVGLIFIGDSLYFKKSAEQDMPLVSSDSPTFSSDGQVAGRKGSVRRGGNVEIPFLSEAEREAIEAVFYECGLTEPFYLDLWQDSDFPPLYGVFTSDLGVVHLEEGDTVSFDFMEVN